MPLNRHFCALNSRKIENDECHFSLLTSRLNNMIGQATSTYVYHLRWDKQISQKNYGNPAFQKLVLLNQHIQSQLSQLQAEVEQVFDEDKGERWMMNPTRNSIARIIK